MQQEYHYKDQEQKQFMSNYHAIVNSDRGRNSSNRQEKSRVSRFSNAPLLSSREEYNSNPVNEYQQNQMNQHSNFQQEAPPIRNSHFSSGRDSSQQYYDRSQNYSHHNSNNQETRTYPQENRPFYSRRDQGEFEQQPVNNYQNSNSSYQREGQHFHHKKSRYDKYPYNKRGHKNHYRHRQYSPKFEDNNQKEESIRSNKYETHRSQQFMEKADIPEGMSDHSAALAKIKRKLNYREYKINQSMFQEVCDELENEKANVHSKTVQNTNFDEEKYIQEDIKSLGITMDEADLGDSKENCYDMIFIRHAFSKINYFYEKHRNLQKNKIIQQHFRFRLFQESHRFIDSELHDYGIKQCQIKQTKINSINVSTVFVSPMARAMQTCVELFKDHPKKASITFYVHSNLGEMLKKDSDIFDYQKFLSIVDEAALQYNIHFETNRYFSPTWQESIIRNQYDLDSQFQLTPSTIKEILKEIFPQPLEDYFSFKKRSLSALRDIQHELNKNTTTNMTNTDHIRKEVFYSNQQNRNTLHNICSNTQNETNLQHNLKENNSQLCNNKSSLNQNNLKDIIQTNELKDLLQTVDNSDSNNQKYNQTHEEQHSSDQKSDINDLTDVNTNGDTLSKHSQREDEQQQLKKLPVTIISHSLVQNNIFSQLGIHLNHEIGNLQIYFHLQK